MKVGDSLAESADRLNENAYGIFADCQPLQG